MLGISGLAMQAQYTPVVQQIRDADYVMTADVTALPQTT
jgi:hypothetical protein